MNTTLRIQARIEQEIEQMFELRDCRRAFGQFYLNNDAALDDVSVLMGHATTRTTELYYCEIVILRPSKTSKESGETKWNCCLE